MIEIRRYEPKYQKMWNSFIKHSKNGTFLFDRNYMDYHSDRFKDSSVLVFENNSLMAVFPANIEDNIIYSHNGLTYGGLVIHESIGAKKTIDFLNEVIQFYKGNGIVKIYYKAIPFIYHKIYNQNDSYALFRLSFKLYRRDISSVINLKQFNIKGKKLNNYKRALKLGFLLKEVNDCKDIIGMYNEQLKKKYHTVAVHTAEEMNLLKKRVKKNILFFNLELKNEIVGGVIVYIINHCVHLQYVIANEYARKLNGTDFLIVELYNRFKNNYIWLSYGISTENNGRFLNESLIKAKEEFNMQGIVHDFYELKIDMGGGK